jgi:hypothetical protein
MQQLQQPDQAKQQVAPIQPVATVLYQSQQIPVTYQNQNTSEVPDKQASAVSTVQVMQASNPSQISTAMLYQGSKTVTPRQQPLLSQVPHTQGRLLSMSCSSQFPWGTSRTTQKGTNETHGCRK